jgi:hypothetical protein
MIPCLWTLYFNSNRIFCAHTLGRFLILLEHLFDLIIVSILNLFFASFGCSLHSLEVSSPCYLFLFAIFDPQYRLISSEYLHVDMCMYFTHFLLVNAHLEEELSLYWPSKHFCPFWQWMPIGEKFWGFEGNWALCFGFVLKHLPCMLFMVEYIVETPPTILVGNICN